MPLKSITEPVKYFSIIKNICKENNLRSYLATSPLLRSPFVFAININTGVLCPKAGRIPDVLFRWTFRSDVIIGTPMAWTTSWLARSYVCQHGLPERTLQYDGWLQCSPRDMKVTQHGFLHQTASCYKEKNILMLQIYYKRIFIFITFYKYLFVSSWQFCGLTGNIFWENSPLVCLREELLLSSLGR